MNVCESCKKYSQSTNPCLGVRGFDGYYTWGTPIHKNDLNEYPSYVMDSAQSPNKPEDCFGFESLIHNEIEESFGHPVDHWSGLTY